MKMKQTIIKRGETYWVNLDPTVGSEIRKKRPCIIISATPINRARRTVIAIPLSSSGKSFPPLSIPIQCLNKNTIAVCDQIRAIDKSRLLNPIGKITDKELKHLEEALSQILAFNQIS